MRRVLALVFAWAVLVAGGPASLWAQGSSDAPPPPLPQQQFDAIVGATKKAVLDELKTPAAPAAAAAAPATSIEDEPASLLGAFGDRLVEVLRATPRIGDALVAVVRSLDGAAAGGRSASGFLLMLLGAAAAGLLAEFVVRIALARPKLNLAPACGAGRGLASLPYLGLLALLDVVAVLGLWLVAHFMTGAEALQATPAQQRVAVTALAALLTWRLYALILRVILRPDVPAARLCAVDDRLAIDLYRRTLTLLAVFIAVRLVSGLMAAQDGTQDALVSLRLLTSLPALALLLWLVITGRPAITQWLAGLGETSRFAAYGARHWTPIMTTFMVALVATQIYGVVSGQPHVPTALLLTINAFAALLLFETLLQALVRRLDSQLAGYTPASAAPTLADVIARCVRVAALILVLIVVSRSWVVNVLGLVDSHAWNHITRESHIAGLTLFGAYVLWEVFRYSTDAYLRRHLAGMSETRATRLGTLIPLLRVTVAIVLTIVAVLIALENIGVNVTPLLAGASVLGLALSFGSQTLVRDIVSGIFYLTDDAFRVGEYIECEKAKGTVESFTLRSIRLRSPNGQIHTIPFGEMGHVSNFSRDWTAVDFSLRFARDVDLDRLRAVTEGISGEIQQVAALRDVLLEPLKMQGIAEVADNALVVRFKFVARPGQSAPVQNEAVTRMLRAFPEQGIAFAS